MEGHMPITNGVGINVIWRNPSGFAQIRLYFVGAVLWIMCHLPVTGQKGRQLLKILNYEVAHAFPCIQYHLFTCIVSSVKWIKTPVTNKVISMTKYLFQFLQIGGTASATTAPATCETREPNTTVTIPTNTASNANFIQTFMIFFCAYVCPRFFGRFVLLDPP